MVLLSNAPSAPPYIAALQPDTVLVLMSRWALLLEQMAPPTMSVACPFFKVEPDTDAVLLSLKNNEPPSLALLLWNLAALMCTLVFIRAAISPPLPAVLLLNTVLAAPAQRRQPRAHNLPDLGTATFRDTGAAASLFSSNNPSTHPSHLTCPCYYLHLSLVVQKQAAAIPTRPIAFAMAPTHNRIGLVCEMHSATTLS